MPDTDLDIYDVQPTGRAHGFDCDGTGAASLPTYPPSPLGKALRGIRVAAGLSLSQASSMLGLSVMTISQLERGAKALDASGWIQVLESLSDCLDNALCSAEDQWCAPLVTPFEPIEPNSYSRS